MTTMERMMMIRTKQFLVTMLLTAAVAMPVLAYDNIVTHPQFTLYAVQKSVLYKDGSIMKSLGLLPVARQDYLYRARAIDWTWAMPSVRYSLAGIIAEGSYDEDAFPLSLNHFYDPVHDKKLTVSPPGNYSSIDWSTERNGQISGILFNQDFSTADARKFLDTALTYSDGAAEAAADQRTTAMRNMFLALGHAVHHVQDMAQPQHTRDDDHLDNLLVALALGMPSLYNPSRYETYTAERTNFLDGYASGASPNFPDGANSAFRTTADFWKNDVSTGLSQFTANNFVSQGTNFKIFLGTFVSAPSSFSSPQPGASKEWRIGDLYADAGLTVPTGIQLLCGVIGDRCNMKMYQAGPAERDRASALSIFDQDLRLRQLSVNFTWRDLVTTPLDRLFALNRFNFDDAHKTLVARAVSYSAGLINHFFRGRLRVTAPSGGAPFAVADHSAGEGFKKVKVTVANATPFEPLSNGTVQAIARFHRNKCYADNLSGEWRMSSGSFVISCPDYRTPEEHIRVSPTQSASFGVDASQELTFTFSDAIPFDATDLVIQVYFKGTVGSESDSFAVGTVDVSEPTYFGASNATDVFYVDGKWVYYKDIIANIASYPSIDANHNGKFDPPFDVDVRGGTITYLLKINDNTVATATVPEGRFVRLAALVDPNASFILTLQTTGVFNNTAHYTLYPKIAQVDWDQDPPVYFVSTVSLLRELYQFNMVTYYQYWPTPAADVSAMPVSQANDSTIPVSAIMAQ